MSTVPLGEICNVQIGRTPPRSDPRYWGGSNPWASISDLNQGLLITRTKEGITEEGAHAGKLVQPGTVLISFKLSIGKVSIAGIPLYTNEAIAALPIKYPSTLDARYLLRYLESLSLEEGANRAAMGRTLNKKTLSELPIPLPPLDEQRRIAAILDKADAIRQKRRRAIAHLDTLTQSIFQDMFSEIETWTTIGELAESTQYGTSAKAGGTGEWPVLRMGNITYEGQLDLSDLKYLDLQPNDVSKYTVCRGDLLFNRTNSAELVGKTCVVDVDAPLAFAGYLIRARFPRIETAVTVSAYLNSPRGKATLRHMAKAIVGQANINATELRSIRVPAVPEVAENQFVNRVSGLTSSSALFQKQLYNDNLLFASLQSRAFRGEL